MWVNGTVLMSKTSYVYRKKTLCFNSTPAGSYNRRRHFFYKHLTSSRSNLISVIYRATAPKVPQGRDMHNRRWSEAQPTDNGLYSLRKVSQGRKVHNRRWSEAQPTDNGLYSLRKVSQGRDDLYLPVLFHTPVPAGLVRRVRLFFRRLRFAPPTVMHLSSLRDFLMRLP
jgi:hypothetical protein